MDIQIPDIGDFTDIPVVTVLVSVGDRVAVEDALVELESDKATMEVPSPSAGVVKEILVSEGDKVSMGSVIMRFDGAVAELAAKATPVDAPAAEVPAAVAATGTASGAGLSTNVTRNSFVSSSVTGCTWIVTPTFSPPRVIVAFSLATASSVRAARMALLRRACSPCRAMASRSRLVSPDGTLR